MSSTLKSELGRVIEALQVAQKKGCYNLDEAAAVHNAIINIQKVNLDPLDNVNTNDTNANATLVNEKNALVQQCQQLQNERGQLVGLLEEYRKAIEEFKKQHDTLVVQAKQNEERMKGLQTQLNIYEKENTDLKNDLTELINADNEEEDVVIPVVKAKPEKPKKKAATKASKVKL